MGKARKRDAKGVFIVSGPEPRKDCEARWAEELAEAKRTGDVVEVERRLEQQEGKRARQALFIEGLKQMGTVRNGIRKAGVNRKAYREWMANDPEFPEMVLDARQEFAEALEEVVVEGIKTNIPLHRDRIFRDKGFAAGGVDIHYLEKKLRNS